jgi:hypothetical protein
MPVCDTDVGRSTENLTAPVDRIRHSVKCCAHFLAIGKTCNFRLSNQTHTMLQPRFDPGLAQQKRQSALISCLKNEAFTLTSVVNCHFRSSIHRSAFVTSFLQNHFHEFHASNEKSCILTTRSKREHNRCTGRNAIRLYSTGDCNRCSSC